MTTGKQNEDNNKKPAVPVKTTTKPNFQKNNFPKSFGKNMVSKPQIRKSLSGKS